MKQPLRSPGFPLCSKVIGVYEVKMKRETTETCCCLACPHLFFKIRYEQESNAYKDICVESPYEHMHPEVWIWRPYHVWFSNLVYLFSLPTTPLGKILTASSSPVCRWVHSVTNTSCAKKKISGKPIGHWKIPCVQMIFRLKPPFVGDLEFPICRLQIVFLTLMKIRGFIIAIESMDMEFWPLRDFPIAS